MAPATRVSTPLFRTGIANPATALTLCRSLRCLPLLWCRISKSAAKTPSRFRVLPLSDYGLVNSDRSRVSSKTPACRRILRPRRRTLGSARIWRSGSSPFLTRNAKLTPPGRNLAPRLCRIWARARLFIAHPAIALISSPSAAPTKPTEVAALSVATLPKPTLHPITLTNFALTNFTLTNPAVIQVSPHHRLLLRKRYSPRRLGAAAPVISPVISPVASPIIPKKLSIPKISPRPHPHPVSITEAQMVIRRRHPRTPNQRCLLQMIRVHRHPIPVVPSLEISR